MPARPLDKKAKILYIEDNYENRMLVRAVLEAAGYTIVEADQTPRPRTVRPHGRSIPQ